MQPTKCKFFKVSVVYLGYLISRNGAWTDGCEVKAIRNWPVPITITELRNFIRFSNYYRCFIKGYTKVTSPLYDQISRDNATIKRERSRGQMKVGKPLISWRFCAPPPQSWPFANFNKPFKLHTDASAIILGAVLYQEQDGKDRVIGFVSRTLFKCESCYPAHNLEFLALKWAVAESFQEYLYGNTFTTYSDNNPLTYLLTTAKLDTMEHRWIAKLAKFNFTVYYQSGKSNVEVDALSRIPWYQSIRAEAVKAIFKAAVEGPDALMEIYACHKKAISSLILEPPPSMDYCGWLG